MKSLSRAAAHPVDTSLWDSAVVTTNSGMQPPGLSDQRVLSYNWSDDMFDDVYPEEYNVKVPNIHVVVPRGPPRGMVAIPGARFVMGRVNADIFSSTTAVHFVKVDEVYMDGCEISGRLWSMIRAWAVDYGYTDIAEGQFGSKADGTAAGFDHPIVNVSWHDCVKWCNARSEIHGLIPAYYTDNMQSKVYREGIVDIGPANVDWNAGGYRLPTEAEWENAAKGGRNDSCFPWHDSVAGLDWFATALDGTKANFLNSGDPYDNGTTPIIYFDGAQVIDGRKQGRLMVNGYGLFDMAGNVYEWCWNWYAPYAADPHGPASGMFRVMRGGCWRSVSDITLACVYRNCAKPNQVSDAVGFRCVRRR